MTAQRISNIATSEKQDAINNSVVNLLDKLVVLFRSLLKPPYFDPSQNRIRGTVAIESGTVTTVTTVSALTNMGSYLSQAVPLATTRTAWILSCRERIT